MTTNPFNLTTAKLNNVKGTLSKNLPPTTNIKANIIDPIKTIFLKFFDIFLDEVVANNLRKK